MSDERTVTAEIYATCPFSIAEEYAVDYLQRAEKGQDEAIIRFPLRLLSMLARRRVALTFGLHYDADEAGRSHDEIRVRWNTGTPLLPDFHGTVRFRIHAPGTIVVVDGSYRVPLGALGRTFDALIGSRIARGTLRDFTRRIADSLEAHERAWRARVG